MGCIWGFIKNVLAIIGGITVILVIVIGVLVWQLTQPSELDNKMHEVIPSSAAAASFDEKVTQLEEDLLLLAVGKEVTLTLTEKEVTSKIVEEIENADIPVDVKDLRVNFIDDKVLVLGIVDVGVELSAGLEIEMKIDENGEPEIVVGGLDIGKGFGIPDAAKDAIASVIPTEEALTDMIKDLPIDLKDIKVGNGQLTFTGAKN